MQGLNVLWPMAFHISGTPIASISSRIARGEEEAISLYKSYVSLYVKDSQEVDRTVKKFVDPHEVARFFSTVIINDFKSLGFSIDWRRRFTTGDPEYQAFITWQYLHLKEKGVLKRGAHPVLYCVWDKQAVGEDDIKGGDEIGPSVAEYVGVKFEVEPGKYLVAATFRPETVFGVTNVWINPDETYVEAEVDSETWIVSKQSAWKLSYQNKKVNIKREFKGKELVGLKVEAPLTGRVVPVLPAKFVNVDEATGVVYSVPAHAPYDYAALMDVKRDPEKYGVASELVADIEPISIIKIEGYSDYPARDAVEKRGIKSQEERDKLDDATQEIYKAEFYGGVLKDNCGEFAGMKVAEVKEAVKKKLKRIGRGETIYETSPNPMYCRCGGRIVVAVLPDQWFINYGDPVWKRLAWECLNSMKIIPEKYRRLFEETFNWLQMRPVARKRGLGTPLPFDKEWVIESLSDSTIYMAFYTIAHIIREKGITADKLKPEVFDYIFYGKGNVEEVAKLSGIETAVLKQMRKEFTYWYPNDQRHTAIGHITNHLSFFIFHHALLFPREHWPKMITLNEFVIREGAKMSKSKGNVLPLVEVPRKYSADLFRLYVASAASLESVVDWREKDVKVVLGRLIDFWNWIAKISKMPEADEPEKLSIQTKWLISKINSVAKASTEALDSLKIRAYILQAFYGVLEIVEKYEEISTKVSEAERAWALREAAKTWVKLLAPVVPHLAEEAWSVLGCKGFVSTSSWPKYDESKRDVALEEAVDAVFSTIQDIREIMELTGEKYVRAHVYVAPAEWKYKVVKAVTDSENAPKKSIISAIMKDPEIRRHGKDAVKLVDWILEGRIPRSHVDREAELRTFISLKEYIEEKTKLQVIIHDATSPEYDPAGKAKTASPLKPGIFLE